MFVFANFLITVGKLIELINFLLSIYIYIIVFRALVSWVNPDPYNQIVLFLHKSTEPVLSPIRAWLIRTFRREFAIDFSPIVAILGIWILQVLLQNLLVANLVDFAMKLK